MEIRLSSEIYIENAKFEVKKIDFSDQIVRQKIEEINKQQEEILSRKNVDVDKLHDVVQL